MKRKVLFFALAAFFCFFMVNAQAQSSLHTYLKYDDTMEYIGSLAHPMQEVLDVDYVGSTSSYVDIEIEFQSQLRSYWEPYRIYLRQYDGITYAYSIVRTKRVSIYEPFIALKLTRDLISTIAEYMGYSTSDNEKMIRILYGTSERGLTKEQIAAITLMGYLFDD